MYEFLEGEVQARTAAKLVLLVGGVGYELLMPLGTVLPEAGHVRVFTHLAVREDAHTLYGFLDRETRDLFRLLLKVRGVGPTMALAVLSGLDRRELCDAILAEDAARLTRIRGVGKKTAEQILLDLRDKAELVAGAAELASPRGAALAGATTPGEANVQDAIAALASIGYSEKDARKHVERAAQSVDPGDLEALVRTALHG